eukprot:4438531-Prymnesium_polylepis.1
MARVIASFLPRPSARRSSASPRVCSVASASPFATLSRRAAKDCDSSTSRRRGESPHSSFVVAAERVGTPM